MSNIRKISVETLYDVHKDFKDYRKTQDQDSTSNALFVIAKSTNMLSNEWQ